MTNIEPFSHNFKLYIKLLELLQVYKKVLHRDLNILKQAVGTIKEKDEELSQSYGVEGNYCEL